MTGRRGVSDHCVLVRMDLDEADRVEVYDLLRFAKEQGGDYIECVMITDGFCLL